MPNKEPPVGEFNLSRLERVIYGPGKIAALKDEMERRDLHRGLVVTTDVVAELQILKEVTGALRRRVRRGGDARAAKDYRAVAEGNRTVRSRFADQLRRRQSDRFLQGSGLWTIAGPRTHPYRGSHDPFGGGIHVGRRGYGRSHTREEQRPLRPACDAAQ